MIDNLKFLKYLKIKLFEILNDTRAECEISLEALEDIARSILSDVKKFYEKEENMQRFKEWELGNSSSAHLTKKAV